MKSPGPWASLSARKLLTMSYMSSRNGPTPGIDPMPALNWSVASNVLRRCFISLSQVGSSAIATAPSTTSADSAANLASPTAALAAVVPRSLMAGSRSFIAAMRSLVPCVVLSRLLRKPAPNDSLSSSNPTANRFSCPWYVLAAASACPENVCESSWVMSRMSPVASVALLSPAPSFPRLVVLPS